MVDLANREREDHIMTVEDPIEFLHTHKRCLVNQREVGEDTKSFASALKHVLRQDPDIILVGELRDLETISIALTAAETGHLVFATLHTQDAPQTVDRVIDVFPTNQQQQIRGQLAGRDHDGHPGHPGSGPGRRRPGAARRPGGAGARPGPGTGRSRTPSARPGERVGAGHQGQAEHDRRRPGTVGRTVPAGSGHGTSSTSAGPGLSRQTA
jgi:hypothetical protein